MVYHYISLHLDPARSFQTEAFNPLRQPPATRQRWARPARRRSTTMNYLHHFDTATTVEACVAGAGDFGRGILRQAQQMPGMNARIAVDISAETAAQAFEKAGILKPDVPCVSGPLPEAARDVVRRRAREISAPIDEYGVAFEIDFEPGSIGGASEPVPPAFRYWARDGFEVDARLAVIGEHQAVNASLAIRITFDRGPFRRQTHLFKVY